MAHGFLEALEVAMSSHAPLTAVRGLGREERLPTEGVCLAVWPSACQLSERTDRLARSRSQSAGQGARHRPMLESGDD